VPMVLAADPEEDSGGIRVLKAASPACSEARAKLLRVANRIDERKVITAWPMK
jgi:hypothetical protein